MFMLDDAPPPPTSPPFLGHSLLQALPASSQADFGVACFSFILDEQFSLFLLFSWCYCCCCFWFCCCCCTCYRCPPHVLTVINLTGISEIYATNTLCETLSLHAAKCCTVAASRVPNIELSNMFITWKSGNNARSFRNAIALYYRI